MRERPMMIRHLYEVDELLLYAIWNEITIQIRELRTFLKQLDIINKTAAGIFTIYTKERCFFRRFIQNIFYVRCLFKKSDFLYILTSVSI